MINNNKIKAGYKLTEIGVIPEDWEIELIKDKSKITTGSRNTQDKIQDGKYPFFVRSQTVERINSFAYDGEAVLTAGDGVGTGKVFHYINDKFDFHQRVYKISDFHKTLNGYFFYLYFSNHFYRRIMQMTAKSSVDSVRMDMIEKMSIPIPPINEQKAIANTLSDTDELISGLEKLIAKKKAIKQGAMQELLKPKEGWEVKKLGEIAEIKKGQMITSDTIVEGDIPVIAGGKSPAYFNNKANKTKKTITISASGANAGYVWFHNTPIFASDCSTIEENIKYSIEYIYFCLVINQANIYRLQSGGAQPHIHPSDIAILEIPIPKKAIQKEISTILMNIEFEIKVLEKKLEKYKKIKLGMMQVLLTGKVRLV